jgi:hypothetical protein
LSSPWQVENPDGAARILERYRDGIKIAPAKVVIVGHDDDIGAPPSCGVSIRA